MRVHVDIVFCDQKLRLNQPEAWELDLLTALGQLHLQRLFEPLQRAMRALSMEIEDGDYAFDLRALMMKELYGTDDGAGCTWDVGSRFDGIDDMFRLSIVFKCIVNFATRVIVEMEVTGRKTARGLAQTVRVRSIDTRME